MRPLSVVGEKNRATAAWSSPASSPILDPDKIMKTKGQSFSQSLRRIFRRRMRRHDPMLVLNISIFNFTDGWARTLFKNQYERPYAS
jgi:hypothetical protein